MTPAHLSELIGEVYECALEPSRWNHVIGQIAAAVDASAGVVALHDLKADHGVRMFSNGFPSPILQLYGTRLSTQNPIAQAAATRMEGQIDTLSTMFRDDTWERSAINRYMLRPLGLRHLLGMAVLRSQQRGVWLGTFRQTRRGDFGPAEIELFQLLAPHITRVMRISDMLDLQAVAVGRLVGVLDRLSAGVFLLDSSGAVVHFNEAAQLLIEKTGLLHLLRGRLVATSPAAAQRLAAAVQAALSDEFDAQPTQSAIALGDGALGETAVATILPLRGAHASGLDAAAAVFVQHASFAPDISLDAFGALYGLTPAELRVLRELMTASTLSEAAASLGIAYATAKTHLEKIFEKTGMSRQTELMRLVMASAAPLRR